MSVVLFCHNKTKRTLTFAVDDLSFPFAACFADNSIAGFYWRFRQHVAGFTSERTEGFKTIAIGTSHLRIVRYFNFTAFNFWNKKWFEYNRGMKQERECLFRLHHRHDWMNET